MAQQISDFGPSYDTRLKTGILYLCLASLSLFGVFGVLIINKYLLPLFGLTAVAVAIWALHMSRGRDWLVQLLIFLSVLVLIPTRLYKLPVNLPFDLEIHRLVALLIFAYWFALLLVKPGVRLKTSPINTAMWLMFTVALFSIAWNFSALAATDELIGSIKSLLDFSTLVLIFIFVVSNLKTKRDIDLALKGVALLMGFTAIFAVLERLTGYSLFRHLNEFIPFLRAKENATALSLEIIRGGVRVFGSAAHPIAYSVMLALVVPISLHYSHFSQTRQERRLFAALSALLIVAAIFTASRTGFLSLSIIFLILMRYNRQERKSYMLLGLMLLFIVHMLFPGALATFRTTLTPSFIQQTEFGPSEGRVGTRGQDYPLIWQEFVKKPAFGRGFDTFDPSRFFFVDNQYLKFLVEIGLAGVGAFLFLFYKLVSFFWQKRQENAGPADKSFYLVFLADSVVFLAAAFTFDILGFPQVPYLFFVLAGLGVAYALADRNDACARGAEPVQW